ncbi:Stk1 family PASTA domain-containing Ser/Thr kinase [Arthrobacter monumenti]
MQERVTDSLVGAVVDQRYFVQSRLARGGMSTVYLATDQRLERDVALKVMHAHLAEDASFLHRFSQEAKAAARLSHPHVVGVLDQGRDDQLVYLVMEYVPGHTLRAVIDDKAPLTPRLALALLDPVIEGLAAAHEAGLVHRDVKPENVLIAEDSRIKIGDFGLARAVSTSTNTGTLIGTVAYIAPELVTGGAADPRSDIYSVGIMLYEMLTGHHPYTGEIPIQVAFQHVNSEVPAPSQELPGLAEDLDELVQWCTAADPDERPIDGNALLGELRHIRTTLSDAELDFHAERPAAAAESPASGNDDGRTTVIPRQGPGADTATTVMPGALRPGAHSGGQQVDPSHTQVINPKLHPTTVISRQGSPTGDAAPRQQQDYDPDAASPISARAEGRQDKRRQKTLDKQRAKAAQRPEQSLRRGNPRRRALLWIIVLVVISLLASAAAWFLAVGPGALTTVPRVTEKTVAEAQQLLTQRGLESTVTDIHHERISAGLVVRAQPEASMEIRKFEDVTLFVSMGPELFAIPDVTGQSLEAATKTLQDARMSAGNVTEEFNEEEPAGTVLTQSITAGEERRRNTSVELTVSKGPQPIDVPSVVGEPQDAATSTLGAAGLDPVIADETVFHPSIPAGSVVSQEPAAGQLFRGDPVTLTMSKGPEMVEVPNFIGDQVEDAVQELEGLGFEVEVNNILGGFFGTVRDQDPVDQSVPKGSVVTLTVV